MGTPPLSPRAREIPTCATPATPGGSPGGAAETASENAPWLSFDQADGFASFDDTDTPAEVFAVWRIQRRIALSYMAVFLMVTLCVGLAIHMLPWATDPTVFAGFSPGFVLAAFGLYAFFLVVGLAAASLADAVEHRMMGATSVESGSARHDR